MDKKIIYNRKLNKTTELFFLIGFGTYLFYRLYQYSDLIEITKSLKTTLKLVSLVFMLPKILINKYNSREKLVSFALTIVTILFIVLGGDKGLILIPIILIGIKDINIKKIIKLIFAMTAFCVLIHCTYFVIEYTTMNKNFITMFHISDYPITNKIKFKDYNMFAFRYTCLIMQYVYLTNRDRNRIIKSIILFLLSTIVLFISQSRASFVICLIIVLYLLFEKNIYVNRIFNVTKYIAIGGSIILSALAMIIPYDSNSIMLYANIKLNGRIQIFNNAYKYIGINILPSIEKFNGISKAFGSYMMPDNSYISLLLKWGLLLFVILFIITIIIIAKNNDNLIDFYICLLAIWFLTEYISMEFVIYFVPLLVVDNFFNDYK